MPLDPRETQFGLELPGGRHMLRLLGRALCLRCPYCGGPHVMATWFRVKSYCPACGIHFKRGESDYFVGSMMLNLVLSEGVFAIGFVGVLLITWPDVPWRTLEIAGPILMLVVEDGVAGVRSAASPALR